MAGTEPTYRNTWVTGLGGTVKATPGNIKGVLVYASAGNSATATLLDGGAAGATKFVIGIATRYNSFYLYLDEGMKVHCATDIYITLSNCIACVWYE